MEISYQREALPELSGWEQRRDPGLANREELLWYFFPVDILDPQLCRVIETKHAGIPLLRFVLSLIRIMDELSSSDSAVSQYMCTESDDELHFVRRADTAQIRTTFDAAVLEVSMVDLDNAVRDFSLRAIPSGIDPRLR